jgi:hypothetical protein
MRRRSTEPTTKLLSRGTPILVQREQRKAAVGGKSAAGRLTESHCEPAKRNTPELMPCDVNALSWPPFSRRSSRKLEAARDTPLFASGEEINRNWARQLRRSVLQIERSWMRGNFGKKLVGSLD